MALAERAHFMIEIYTLNKILDDPRFEGFALGKLPSVLGFDSLEKDLRSPSTGLANSLAERWPYPEVRGRVQEFNDFPCINFSLPAFSQRAIDALRDLLEPHGEILPLRASTKTQYSAFRVNAVSRAIDLAQSKYRTFDSGRIAEIESFAFDEATFENFPVFRVREWLPEVLVSEAFRQRVYDARLVGFQFVLADKRAVESKGGAHDGVAGGQRNGLEANTLVLVLPSYKRKNEASVRDFENEVDAHLAVKALNDPYYGSYEGHDIVGSEYRMFFTCPDARRLLEHLRALVLALRWKSPVLACMRSGSMYDTGAAEEPRGSSGLEVEGVCLSRRGIGHVDQFSLARRRSCAVMAAAMQSTTTTWPTARAGTPKPHRNRQAAVHAPPKRPQIQG